MLLPAFALAAPGDDFPARRITLVVPFPAGSATDGTARRLAVELARIAAQPVKNMAEYLALAKRSTPPLTFGSASQAGRGAGELMKARAGLPILNVPYKGAPQGLTDLAGGHIDSYFADPVSAAGLIQKGAVRVLAITSARRALSMPAVPTFDESGFPGFELIAWIGAFVPEKTPRAAVLKLNAMLNAILADPLLAASFTANGAAPFPTTPEQLGEFAETDTKRWAQIVEAAKMEKQ